jgi:hypothetical protein
MLTETRPFRENGWKLPSYSQQLLGNALKGCWTGARHCYKDTGKPLGKAQSLLESFWAILKGCRQAAGKCLHTLFQPIVEEAELPSGYWLKHGNFRSFPLNCLIYVYINNKSKTH